MSVSLGGSAGGSEAARAVAVDVAAMLADVAPQLLALLRREPARALFLPLALQLAALEFLAPHFSLALELVPAQLALLLEALEAARTVAGLSLRRKAGGQRNEDTCKDGKAFHGFNPALSGALDAAAQKRRSASCLSW